MLKKGQTIEKKIPGFYAMIKDWLKTRPKKLITYKDLMKQFDAEESPAKNALQYLYRSSQILKHKENSKEGLLRYALDIDDKHSVRYAGRSAQAKVTMKPVYDEDGNVTHRPTSRQINAAFGNAHTTLQKLITQMSLLEDLMTAALEGADEVDQMRKMIARFKL